MSEPRKHHMVAQLYQRGFARQRGKSWQAKVMVRATGETRVGNVRDIFAQRDWNTVEDAEGNKEFGVERLFAEHIDGPAAPALEDLRQDRFPLLDWRREHLAMFMAAQLSRGRFARENLAQFVSEVSRLMMRMTVAHYSDEQWVDAVGEVPSPAMRKKLASNDVDIRPTNGMLLKAMLGSVTEIAGYLSQRTWTLVRFPEPCLFTGETPVVHINPSGDTGGFGVVTAERMFMPISPTRALVLSHPWTNWPERCVDGAHELARRLNWATLTCGTNDHLLMHPDTAAHALPGPVTLATAPDIWWPWGEDPGSKPPAYLGVLADARERRPRFSAAA